MAVSERFWRRKNTGVATIVAGALLFASCGQSDPGSDLAVLSKADDSPASLQFDAFAVSRAASFTASDAATARISPDGVQLDVHALYLEPVSFEGWTAPEQCSFNTLVELEIDGGRFVFESPPLEGPTSDDDRTNNGVLAATVPWESDDGADSDSMLVVVVLFDHDTAATIAAVTEAESPDEPSEESAVPDAEVTVEEETADDEIADDENAEDENADEDTADDPTDDEDAADESADDDSADDENAADDPTDDETDDGEDGEGVDPSDDTEAPDEPSEEKLDTPTNSATDTQPVDGWTPLAVLVSADTDPTSVDVELRFSRQDGSEESTLISVPTDLAPGQMANLTDAWRFDESLVDESCTPPEKTPEEPTNTTVPTPVDLVGEIIGDQPELPDPGDQPADPEAATAEAMAAIRTVYDIYNLYDPAKHAFLDDPVLAAQIFEETQSIQLVEPLVGELDPIFDSMVFTSSTTGEVLYRVGPIYQWEIGRVLIVDGTWRVALGTLCRDLSDALYICPNVELDPRPGPLG